MRLVILESPFAGDVKRNVIYATMCLRDCLMRGEAPFASHLFYTQALDDNQEHERGVGIEAGLAWGRKAEATVVYTDLGISGGMKLGLKRAERECRPIEHRTLRSETKKRNSSCAHCRNGDRRVVHGTGGAHVHIIGDFDNIVPCEADSSDAVDATKSDEPTLELLSVFSLPICSLCLDGMSGECHTPACIFWMNRAPDLPLRETLTDYGGFIETT